MKKIVSRRSPKCVHKMYRPNLPIASLALWSVCVRLCTWLSCHARSRLRDVWMLRAIARREKRSRRKGELDWKKGKGMGRGQRKMSGVRAEQDLIVKLAFRLRKEAKKRILFRIHTNFLFFLFFSSLLGPLPLASLSISSPLLLHGENHEGWTHHAQFRVKTINPSKTHSELYIFFQ